MAHDKDGSVGLENAKTPKEEKQITLTETELHELLEKNMREMITTIEHKEQFSGPVPHPDHMRVYKGIDKSLPNRFTTMAEKNQSHRIWVEKFVILGELGMGVLGWLTPTAISFYVLSAGISFVEQGKSAEALVSLVVALGSLVGAFYMKNRAKNTDEE